MPKILTKCSKRKTRPRKVNPKSKEGNRKFNKPTKRTRKTYPRR